MFLNMRKEQAMKKVFILLSIVLMIGAIITLPGCGGGGGGGSHDTNDPATYSITGKIISNNTGLAGVIVSLSGADTDSTMTDAEGNYSFNGLTNGNYTVTPSLAGHIFTPSGTVVIIDGIDRTDIDFTATASTTPTYTISGTISGAVISGVTITLAGTSSGSALTDASGHYSFSGLANGSYTITPSKTGYTFNPTTISVTVNNADMTGQSFTATAITTPTYTISGKVSGDVASGVTITLAGTSSGSALTDTGGNYSFGGLASGSYTLTALKTGYTFSPTTISVTVNNANLTGQNFTATAITTPTYTISGKVSGDVVSGVTITLTGTGSSSVTTDSSGNYSFSGAANGSYTITPSRSGYTFSPASIGIMVNNANVTGKNFTATANTTSTYIIAGTVSGDVKAGVTINLSGAKVASTTTDAVGNYSFSGITNGIHTITPSKTGYTFSPASISVSVYNANILGQNFISTTSTPLTYSISGTVSGATTSGVTITLSGIGSSTTTTDAGGNYSFSGAANGNYTITPAKSGYTFSPASRSIVVNNANVTGQNFAATSSSITYSSAGGVPISGYPNWQVRAFLVITNAVRQAPQAYRSTYTSFTNILLPANYPAVAPVYWNENLNHAARAHATDMATTPCFQHNSCDGTDGITRISSYYPSALFLAENIAAGISTPKAAIDLLICESANPANCATDKTVYDGHRQNIMNANAKELGTGYYYYAGSPYGYYWVQDFGATALPIFQPPIVSGTHMVLNSQLTFWLNYYAAAAPQEVRLVINGSSVSMTLAIGSAQSGLYTATAGADSVCQSYHFEAVDSSGQGWRYPGTGEFRTYGINSCTEDYRN